jgi:hypothetical protein|tara:strand:- start:568 stop:798 length:231 start_codon:yes stop_codon:yes gene_type:complete
MCHIYKPNLLSRQEIDESLIDYNSFHLTMFDIDNVHLFNDIQQMDTDNLQFIIGILISLYGIYAFGVEIINSFKKN